MRSVNATGLVAAWMAGAVAPGATAQVPGNGATLSLGTTGAQTLSPGLAYPL